tara:strand:- start:23 stop:577 length:555 start_codon:yes stop_codon:yes gene_type:complete
MLFLKKILLLIFCISSSSQIFGISFPILPEIQAYHNVGSRGSNYTTGAIGLSIHIYDEQNGPGRYLHFLRLNIPKEIFGWKSRIGNTFLSEDGDGFELGVHDQWEKPFGKGASLSIRKIKWPNVVRGDSVSGEGISEILHLGWSWVSGKPVFLVWLMGLDVASINLPHDRIFEIEIGLGIRTNF